MVVGAGCAAQLQIDPSTAAPGDIVRLSSDAPTFAKPPAGQVTIGGQPTAVLHTIGDRQADVLVPVTSAGSVDVEVGGDRQARGKMVVLPARNRELILSVTKDAIRPLLSRPIAGAAAGGRVQAERRLSYDVINAKGGLAFTGVVASPIGPREVYDGPDAKGTVLRQGPPPAEGVVSLKLPNLPRPFVVRFYDVPSGSDLDTEAGRQTRRPLGEVTIKDEGGTP